MHNMDPNDYLKMMGDIFSSQSNISKCVKNFSIGSSRINKHRKIIIDSVFNYLIAIDFLFFENLFSNIKEQLKNIQNHLSRDFSLNDFFFLLDLVL